MEDLIRDLRVNKISVELSENLWEQFDSNLYKIVHVADWKTFKYIDEFGNLSDWISHVSCDTGGIYLFYVSPEIIPERQRVLLYVGRAQKSKTQNLRKRITEYYKYYESDQWDRPKIKQMFRCWSKYLYCSYLEIDDNDLVIRLEAEIINRLLPPCNAAIPNQDISVAVRAAGL